MMQCNVGIAGKEDPSRRPAHRCVGWYCIPHTRSHDLLTELSAVLLRTSLHLKQFRYTGRNACHCKEV